MPTIWLRGGYGFRMWMWLVLLQPRSRKMVLVSQKHMLIVIVLFPSQCPSSSQTETSNTQYFCGTGMGARILQWDVEEIYS
ncbi:hypothetical protein BDZ94DRAFT_1268884 [Collybia nuda]|uniref:Secreted protein n=1 Tax=Collybia nuda TaxID=64659 RepID=A0A9P5XWW2_9AGAR|nr:hypothetical protein BDZ94DRAFT_1268884 [Collybia nuda]